MAAISSKPSSSHSLASPPVLLSGLCGPSVPNARPGPRVSPATGSRTDAASRRAARGAAAAAPMRRARLRALPGGPWGALGRSAGPRLLPGCAGAGRSRQAGADPPAAPGLCSGRQDVFPAAPLPLAPSQEPSAPSLMALQRKPGRRALFSVVVVRP